MASHVRMVAGLYLLVALLNPLKEGISLLRSLADGDMVSRVESLIPTDVETNYSGVFGDSLAAIGADEVSSWVTETMESRFGIPPEGCTVWASCDYGEDTLTVTEVRISLKGSYALRDPHPIESYVSSQLNCPCYVTVE